MADNGRRGTGGSGGHRAQQPLDTPPMARFRSDRKEGWSRSPRSLFLRRCDNGFGFTLRHFIVYPPESYTVLQGDHRLGFHHGRQGAALDEPMDTIFVKNVRENSPAYAAGLATGDRIISVNGQTITGHTYAQVVQLIQQSGSFLHLLVVPKEDDILQLYFGETAHNPETNQRPSRVKSPEVAERRHPAGSMLQHHLGSQQGSHHHHHRHHNSSQHRSLQQPGENGPDTWSSPSPPEGLIVGSENRGTSGYRSGQDPTWYRAHHHSKSATGRRNSEGTGLTRREAVYGYAPATSSDFRIIRNNHQYYGTPGSERRISADNTVWGTGPGVNSVFKPLQILDERRLVSNDEVVTSGSASLYPATKPDNSRNLLSVQRQQLLVTPTPSSDSMASSRYGSSENVHGSSNSLQGLYYPGSAGCRLSLDGGRRESSVSLPSSSIHDNFTSDGSKDSLLSYDSTSTLTGGQECCSSDDSLIISRIRKSFEQKEEFLRRPNQPISWNLPENVSQQQLQQTIPLSTHAQAIIAREFYARPQKFQRPVWPPQSPSASPSPTSYRQQSPSRASGGGKTNHSSTANSKPTHQSLRRVKSDIDSERDSLTVRNSNNEVHSATTFERAASEPCEDYSKSKGQFICGGPVTNVPPPTINKGGYSQNIDNGAAQFWPIMPVTGTTPGTNHRHAVGKTAFVTTLSRIHENIPASDPLGDYLSSSYASSNMNDGYNEPYSNGGTSSLPPSLPSSPVADSQQFSRSLSSPTEENNTGSTHYPQHPMLQLVSRRARQFETGVLDEEESPSDRTSLYRSELSRLSAKKSVPNVAVRKREFESRAGTSTGSTTRESRRPNRESRSLESAEPPSSAQDDPSSGPVKLRARSNSAESWAAMGGSRSRNTLEWPPSRAQEPEPQRHKAVRQDSYLAAVRTPVSTDRPSRLKRQAALSVDEEPGEMEELAIVAPVTPTAPPALLVQPASPSHPAVRPTQLPIPYPLRPAEPTREPHTAGGYDDERHDSVGRLVAAPDGTTTAEEERLGRRVSYLKATWGDRMHVDSDLDLSDCESPHMPHRSNIIHGHAIDKPIQLEGIENLALVKEGFLHMKVTLIDGKRANDRSWKTIWAVLRGPILALYKEKRDHPIVQTPMGEGEQQVDTRLSQVEIADDYTKRKHVLRVNTSTGSEVLLQADDAEDMASWLQCLTEFTHVPEELGNDCKKQASPQLASSSSSSNIKLSPVPTHKGIRKLTALRNRSPTGQPAVGKPRKHSQAEQLTSPKHKTWKGRVARQFRRIQHGGSSPSSPTAQHAEGVTIGIPLEDCPPGTYCMFVPLLVELCASVVDTRGLDVVGIYRVPGNTAAVSALTDSINKGLDNISLQDPRWQDVNVISSLLKLFFRRLPDALLTSDLYPSFIEADKIDDSNIRLTAIKKLVHELPDCHYETLKYLLYHLKRVVEHSERNKMEARNLAIVFGPTLVRTADCDMVTMVTDMSHQCRIVESLINHVEWFYSEDESAQISNFPFTPTQEPQDIEATSANHNLLLSNISKVQGIKSDPPSRDINAKVLVTSIISAANRKIQKSKSRKRAEGTSSVPDEGQECAENLEERKIMFELKARTGPEASYAGDEALPTQSSVVASSIMDSVILSGDIVKHLQTNEEILTSEKLQDTDAENKYGIRWEAESSGKIQSCEEGTIRTYAGLSATTQERIRRFELETKAMLQRDQSRHRQELEQREADKQRIELQWQQAKKEMEVEDQLDQIAESIGDTKKSKIHSLDEDVLHLQTLSLIDDSAPVGVTTYTDPMELTPYNVPYKTKVRASSSSCGHSNIIDANEENSAVAPFTLIPSEEPDRKEVPQDCGIASAKAFLKKSLKTPQLLTTLDLALDPDTNVQEYLSINRMKRQSHDVDDYEEIEIEDVKQEAPHKSADRCEEKVEDCPKSQHWGGGSDLLASLTSTFDRKMKTLLYTPTSTSGIATVPCPSVIEATLLDTKPLLDKQSNQSHEQFNKSADGEEATVGKPHVPSNPQEVSTASEDIQTAPTQKGVLTTASALFRDPSLHRGRSSPLERQSRVDQLVESMDSRWMESKSNRSQDQDRGRGRTRVTLTSNSDKNKDEMCMGDKEGLGTKLKHSESLSKTEKMESTLSSTKLKRSESLSKAEKEEMTFTNTKLKRSESLTKAEKVSNSNTKLRRSESLTKAERADSPSNTKLKRSDSLTKTEKTESNNSKRKQDLLLLSSSLRNSNRGCNKEKENTTMNLTKLKRKNGMPERSIKRRHTVGGTKDFDKLNWLDNRLQQEQQDENEAAMAINNKERQCLRTSSPDLSSSRLGGNIGRERFLVEIRMLGSGGIMAELRPHITPTTGRPHSLPDPNLASRVFKVPLESHV